jgi:acetyl esterase/lipase/lysophospholipase L1-like esterase
MLFLSRLCLFMTMALLAVPSLSAQVGQDVAAVFQRAKAGAPLRYVALGGSITQSGEGWIGPWLKEQFPESDVKVVNSGMSATGSALGIFRVDRDVIVHQPDLVVIEYCVNDVRLSDEDAVRNVESLVVRLKSLPNPPAIIIVEAASKGGVNLVRHRKVAKHYGLMEIDLQAAVNDELEKPDVNWETFFGDNVHPNAEGNAFYTEVMVEALTPYLNQDINFREPPLPTPLSKKPLILDGRMVPLSGYSEEPGWRIENALSAWWGRFFKGVLRSDTPEASLTLPFRGTRVGLYFAMDPSYGTFYASLDGAEPKHVSTNSRGGYSFEVFGMDLEACEHQLTVVLPPELDPAANMNGPVKFGYLLVAGESQASRQPALQGAFQISDITSQRYEVVTFDGWKWAGAYRLETANTPVDAESLLSVTFAPELDPDSVDWSAIIGSDQHTLNFKELSGEEMPSAAYVSGSIECDKVERVMLALRVDYFAKVWLNGVLLQPIDFLHGSPKEYAYVPATLQAGRNELMIKVAAGSGGHSLQLSILRSEKISKAGEGRNMNAPKLAELGTNARSFKNVAYGPYERNVMDVWLADSDKPAPCVVFIHGGGWINGDKSKEANPAPFLKNGISYVAINYRYLQQTIIDSGSERGTGPVLPRGDYPEAPVRVPLYDAARSIQFVRSHAKQWNIDSKRIGLTGSSAGACTSLWLAYHDDLANPTAADPILRESTRVWCAAVNVAQTTLDPQQILEWMPNATYGGHAFGYLWDSSDFTVEIRSFLADRENVTEWIAEYSPYALLSKDDPPVYLYYADAPEKGIEPNDPTHSANYGALLVEKLEALGVDYEFVHSGVDAPQFKSASAYLIHQLLQ